MRNTLFQVQVGAPVPLFSKTTAFANQETEILSGERFLVLSEQGSWLEVVTELDGYYGYLQLEHVTARASQEQYLFTHYVDVASANVYSSPTFKSVKVCELAFNARIRVHKSLATSEGRMVCVGEDAWIFENQLREKGKLYHDFVDVCEKLVGRPYHWAGRGSNGWDCSSAIQAICHAGGYACPRDTGPQSRELGELLHPYTTYQRGDFIFWLEDKGRHVAVMTDTEYAFHFTISSPYRCGVIMPLSKIIEDQRSHGNGNPTLARRLLEYHTRAR